MKLYPFFLLILLIGCDAVQSASGVVLNSKTRKPLPAVGISPYEKEDASNPYTRKIYSDSNGQFNYHSVGFSSSFELFFIKKGYKTLKINSEDLDSVILMDPIE